MTEFDPVHHPRHYLSHPSGVEPIEICRHLSGDWFNAFKYVFRAEHKNGRQDIEKALYYAEDGVAHQNIPMRLPSWTDYETALLNGIIDYEPDSTKRTFYNAIQQQSAAGARACIEHILKGWPT